MDSEFSRSNKEKGEDKNFCKRAEDFCLVFGERFFGNADGSMAKGGFPGVKGIGQEKDEGVEASQGAVKDEDDGRKREENGGEETVGTKIAAY